MTPRFKVAKMAQCFPKAHPTHFLGLRSDGSPCGRMRDDAAAVWRRHAAAAPSRILQHGP